MQSILSKTRLNLRFIGFRALLLERYQMIFNVCCQADLGGLEIVNSTYY